MMVERYRLGFVLARRSIELPWLPGTQYRGIDRLPFVPDFVTQSQPKSVEKAWQPYLDAWEDGRLSRDIRLAMQGRDQLNELGADVEVVFAEAVVPAIPEQSRLTEADVSQRSRSLEWLRVRASEIGARPPEFTQLGIDVSSAIPDFHSAIFQPGPVPHDADLVVKLNEHGLLSDAQYAESLADDANETGYLSGLFALVQIWTEPM
jgi:hypothetical protein